MPISMTLEHLDDEAGRWLRYRAIARAEKARTPSPLDGVTMSLRRLRTKLGSVAACGVSDPRLSTVCDRGYRFVIRVAQELEAIEREDLEPMDEWQRFEAFAPFARAFYETILARPMERAGGASFIRDDVEAILGTVDDAMASFALAA